MQTVWGQNIFSHLELTGALPLPSRSAKSQFYPEHPLLIQIIAFECVHLLLSIVLD